MVDRRLSELPETTSLDNSDQLYVNDSGSSRRISVANLATSLGVSSSNPLLTSLENLNDGEIPVKEGLQFESSSLTESTEELNVNKNCVFLPSETRFGSTSLRVSGDLFYTHSSRTDRSFFALGTPFTTAGTGTPMTLSLEATETMPSSAQQPSTDTTITLHETADTWHNAVLMTPRPS